MYNYKRWALTNVISASKDTNYFNVEDLEQKIALEEKNRFITFGELMTNFKSIHRHQGYVSKCDHNFTDIINKIEI